MRGSQTPCRLGKMTDHYQLVVLGSGQGGGPLAGAFAKAGRRALLIEQAHVGGTCVNEGCTPTKTMVASARVVHLARRGADFGAKTPSPRSEPEHGISDATFST